LFAILTINYNLSLSRLGHQEACIEVLFAHRIVPILRRAPTLQRIHVHELFRFVDLGWLTRDLLICVLQEVKVSREANVRVASLTQVAVVSVPSGGVLQLVRHHRRINAFDSASQRHQERVKISKDQTMIRYDFVYLL
jgi:hypothetical protein